MFGLKVSRSGVARYAERLRIEHASRQQPKQVVEITSEPGTKEWTEESYQLLQAKLLALAHDMMQRIEFDWRFDGGPKANDVKWVCTLMGIMIATRREANDATMTKIYRAKYERWAAKQVLKECRRQQREKRRQAALRDAKPRKTFRLRTVTWNPPPSNRPPLTKEQKEAMREILRAPNPYAVPERSGTTTCCPAQEKSAAVINRRYGIKVVL
jgi:hypothetical protein